MTKIISKKITGELYCDLNKQSSLTKKFIIKKYKIKEHTPKEWEDIFKKERLT